MFLICYRCHVEVVDGICYCTDPELFKAPKESPAEDTIGTPKEDPTQGS